MWSIWCDYGDGRIEMVAERPFAAIAKQAAEFHDAVEWGNDVDKA